MPPRALVRNAEALAGAVSPTNRGLLLARRAELLARMFDLDEARRSLAQAQACLDEAGADDALALELALARGVVQTFEQDLSSAKQTLQVTRAAARERGRHSVAASCAAVLAITHLKLGEMVDLVPMARAALDERAPADQETAYRAHLALGMAQHYAGNFVAAHEAFVAARDAAVAADDEVGQASLLQAIVIAQASEVRQQAAAGTLDPEHARQALAAIQQAIEQDVSTGMHVDVSAERLIEAELHWRCGDAEAARRIVQAHLPRAESLNLTPHHALGLAVRAACAAATDPAQCAGDVHAATQAVERFGVPDVEAPVLSVAAAALRTAGFAADAAVLEQRAQRAWSELLLRQRTARAALARGSQAD